MTLEQIKNRQERINDQLFGLLKNTESVVLTIIGDIPSEEQDLKSETPSGLLQEISAYQNRTEYLIEQINRYNELLTSRTYTPVEAVCQAR